MGQDGEKVFLYLYDLSQGMARQLSATFLGNTIQGVWHSGIGLFGKEYFYGAGIQCVPTGHSPFGVPVEVLELGYTHIPKDIFEEFLREIGPRFTMATYSLLNHNCNNFTDEAAEFLVGSGIPHHIFETGRCSFEQPPGSLDVAHVAAAGNYAATWRGSSGSCKQLWWFITMAKPIGPTQVDLQSFYVQRFAVSVSGSIPSGGS